MNNILLGSEVKTDESKVHPCWAAEAKKELLSHVGIVIGYNMSSDGNDGKMLIQVAWPKGCGFTLHTSQCNVVVVGNTDIETRQKNLAEKVYLDLTAFGPEGDCGKWTRR